MPKTRVAHIEVQPVSHCTLACVGCQHYSPQRASEFDGGTRYRTHLAALWSFCAWDFLFVGGGEPFLHPDLPGFLTTIQDGPWRGTSPDVITNGFWLLRRDWRERAATVLPLTKVLIVSRYPAYVDRLGVAEWDRRLDVLRGDHRGVQITSFHSGDPADLTFTQNLFHDEPHRVLAPNPCAMKTCVQLLPDGRLSRCPLGRVLGSIPNATPAFREAYEFSGFWPVAWGGSGFETWLRPDSFLACEFCGIGTGDSWPIPWSSDLQARTAQGARYDALIQIPIAIKPSA